MVDGWARNVCGVCSDEDGWFFSSSVGLPAQHHQASEQLAAMGESARAYLRQEVPCEFWLMVHERFRQANQDARMSLVRSSMASHVMTYRKFLSHYGALRCPPEIVPLGLEPPALDGCGVYDPGNAVYKETFLACWPGAAQTLGLSNEETVGDLLEGLLGWVSFRRYALPQRASRIVEELEKACLAVFLLAQTPARGWG